MTSENLNIVLTNPVHSIPANYSGTPLSYANSGTDVYIYEGANLVSVNITNANYETKYEASQQLFNLVISFTYSQNRKRQRR